jgi:hypothetical protein
MRLTCGAYICEPQGEEGGIWEGCALEGADDVGLGGMAEAFMYVHHPISNRKHTIDGIGVDAVGG